MERRDGRCAAATRTRRRESARARTRSTPRLALVRAHEVALDQSRRRRRRRRRVSARSSVEIEALARSPPPPASRACPRAEAGRGAPARRSGSTPGTASSSVPLRSSWTRNSGLPCARSTQRCARSGDVAKWMRASASASLRGERRQIEARRPLGEATASRTRRPRAASSSATRPDGVGRSRRSSAGTRAPTARPSARPRPAARRARCAAARATTSASASRLPSLRARRCPSHRRRRPPRCAHDEQVGRDRAHGPRPTRPLRERLRERVAPHRRRRHAAGRRARLQNSA